MKVKAFGSYNFPYALGEDKRVMASLAGARMILGAAGYWDDLGDLVVLRPGIVEVKLAFYDDDSWTDIDTAIDTAKKNLFLERESLKLAPGDGSGSATREALARCVSFDEVWRYDTPRLVVASAKFELLQPHWDSTNLSSASFTAGSFSVDNSGSTCRTERTLTIKLNGPVNTLFTLVNQTLGGWWIKYDGASKPIAGGKYVNFYCGSLIAALYSGYESVWQYVTLGSNSGESRTGFMALAPQVNQFTASPTYPLQFYWYESYV